MAEPGFDRGFKTWCENVAASTRGELQLSTTSPLSATNLADHLGVHIWKPEDMGLKSRTIRMLLRDSSDWSALTVVQGEKTAVIYNSDHSGGRAASDIMHELAHLILEHKAGAVVVSRQTKLVIRSFDRKQEAEAAWLAGCLLLPRPALLRIAKSGSERSAVCREYGVSAALLTYRLDVTGVTAQMKHRRRRG